MGSTNDNVGALEDSVVIPWRCFHCGDVFTDFDRAKEHFGGYMHSEPAYQIDIAKFREMEAELERLRVDIECESSEGMRMFHELRARMELEKRREEENGYARGLRDAQRYPEEIGLARPRDGN